MAEEEVVAAAASASPVPSDHKRKLEDLEPDAPQPLTADLNVSPESDSVEKADDCEESVITGGSEAKRPRLEDSKSDRQATENGYEEEKVDKPQEEGDAEEPAVENAVQSEDAQESVKEAPKTEEDSEQPAANDHESEDFQSSDEKEKLQLEKDEEQEPSKGEFQEPSTEVLPLEDISSTEQESQQPPLSESPTMSRKMEVPNNKVGVLIGKAGDTIRFLQLNSGAKIQIMRDADADLSSTTRPVEVIGTLESINKAEKLIKDVIAEADAGGSPSLVARGFSTVQAVGAGEQIQIQVPNEKVGLIIGKGGETIKNLQTRSGARIQLIPQHLPEGDQSKERTVRVTGDMRQIEMAREMIKEVMNQEMVDFKMKF
ncbi:unnamed protein product [Ilex paraguariensis]|uniref:K Homology domain-containing protein n=1 Tax=Ilex paraguariensis TaxID=185542 RepID=A0ABC8RRM4_9AQUA